MGIFKKNKIVFEDDNAKTPVRFRRKSREKALSNNHRKKNLKRAIITFIVLLVLGGGGFYGWKAYSAIKKMFADDSGGILSLLAGSQNQPLKGESSGRVNVLLLGIGGAEHSGGDLTDTIMVASYDVKTKAVAMFSIPRDLYVKIPDNGYSKVNAAHAYGEQRKKGSGIDLAKRTIENVVGIPIHYTVRIDFDGFKDVIDSIGGVTVDVENSFCDYAYPVELKGDTRTVCFKAGVQTMNGIKALQYSRSRHAYGIEGSDFARSKRQQRVLVAIKEKAMSQSTYLNPKKMLDLLTALGDHIKSDFQLADLVRIGDLAKEVNTSTILSRNFDSSAEGLLVSSSSEAGYILKPRTGNFKEIQGVVKNIFAIVAATQEKATIAIYNGTWVNGVAAQLQESMKKEGYNVVYAGNSDQRNYKKTQIIDLSAGAKAETIKSLEQKFGVTATSQTSQTTTFEIKIIVGSDYIEGL